MTNIRDFESAWLGAQAKFDTWVMEFERDFFAPAGELIMRELIATMTEEQKKEMRAMNPEGYDSVMKQLGME